MNSLNDADPDTASSTGASRVPWIAARYTEFPWVLQETFLKAHLLEKDHPQLSSRIHGIWHHLLADCDQVIREILWNMVEG